MVGCALSDRGDFDESLAELRRSLRTRLLVFGKEHIWGSSFLTIGEPSILVAKGNLTSDEIASYKAVVIDSGLGIGE